MSLLFITFNEVVITLLVLFKTGVLTAVALADLDWSLYHLLLLLPAAAGVGGGGGAVVI